MFFLFKDTATTQIYTLSLSDALPITSPPEGTTPLPVRAGAPASARTPASSGPPPGRTAEGAVALRGGGDTRPARRPGERLDRKSTRLNSSHANISYAVFCL